MNPDVTELSSRETKVNNNSKNLYSAYADQELFYDHCWTDWIISFPDGVVGSILPHNV